MAPAVPTVTTDTADLRVTTWAFDTDAATGQHRHEYDYVVVPVTGGTFTVTDLDGRMSTLRQAAGVAYLGTAGTAHDVANATGRPVSFVEVERRR